MKATEIFTITKEEFNKLSAKKQRLAVIQDVLDRIKLGQLKAETGKFCSINKPDRLMFENQISELLKTTETTCVVCAKGGLFMSYIGIVNSYSDRCGLSSSNDSYAMDRLSEVFSKRQLTMIESAFEGADFSEGNDGKPDIMSSINFGLKFNTDRKRLIAICNNMMENEGIFKPKLV